MLLSKVFLLLIIIVQYGRTAGHLNITRSNTLVNTVAYKTSKIFEMQQQVNNLNIIALKKEKEIKQLKKTIIRLKAQMVLSSNPPKNETVEGRLQHLEELSKTQSLRSCHEYEEYGTKRSGMYEIDPDGPLIGSPPFLVYCDFELHTTEVTHNHEGATNEIDHCTGHMCYHLDIKYPADIQQIVSLIDLSETCTQDISFDCFLAPLYTDNQPIGVWVNRNGENEIYFTGSNSGQHICECGVIRNCSGAERNLTCNCDAADLPIMQNDSGKITNMTELPITGFNYDDVLKEPSQFAAIRIGRLICKGRRSVWPTDLCNSCRNLKIDGEFHSGNYALNDGSMAYCHMEKSLNDPELQENIGQIIYKNVM